MRSRGLAKPDLAAGASGSGPSCSNHGAVAIGGSSPRSFARFVYTFLSKPKARSCRCHVSRLISKRSQAALISASGMAAKFSGTRKVRCQATSFAASGWSGMYRGLDWGGLSFGGGLRKHGLFLPQVSLTLRLAQCLLILRISASAPTQSGRNTGACAWPRFTRAAPRDRSPRVSSLCPARDAVATRDVRKLDSTRQLEGR